MAGNAEQAGSSLKRRSPDEVRVIRASKANVISYQEENVMTNISTVKSNVIPFDFKGHSVRAISIEGEPWFVAADVCRALGHSNTTKALYALDEDERSNFKLGRQGAVNIINESGLYTLILRCDDAIKKGSNAHAFRKWVTAEVLPSIRREGRYEDDRARMATLVGEVIGTTGELVLDRVIEQKASIIHDGLRRSFKHTMKSRLRSRFNVQKTALIPAGEMANACNFVAAYAIEGEWLAKEREQGKLIDFSCSIEDWIARNPQCFGVTKHRGGDLGVTVGDLVLSKDSPCLELLDKMHNAGYQVEGAFYEFRSYQNLMRQMDYLMKAAGGAISQALGTLERGRMKPQEYAGVQAVAA